MLVNFFLVFSLNVKKPKTNNLINRSEKKHKQGSFSCYTKRYSFRGNSYILERKLFFPQLSTSLLCGPSYGAGEIINLNQTPPTCFILEALSVPTCCLLCILDPEREHRRSPPQITHADKHTYSPLRTLNSAALTRWIF